MNVLIPENLGDFRGSTGVYWRFFLSDIWAHTVTEYRANTFKESTVNDGHHQFIDFSCLEIAVALNWQSKHTHIAGGVCVHKTDILTGLFRILLRVNGSRSERL